MVLGSKAAGIKGFSEGIRKTMQSIREIVGNHSNDEIYAVLKESNMDPNETAQKLLHQDPFHEVKRKRDKKKENAGHATELTQTQQIGPNLKKKITLSVNHFENTKHQNVRASVKNAVPRVTREFRVVRDNRVNQNTDKNVTEAFHCHTSSRNEQSTSTARGIRNNEWRLQYQGQGQIPFQYPNDENAKDDCSIDSSRKHPERLTSQVSHSTSGLYSTYSDPIHVPSPDSRPAGAVGIHRLSSDWPSSASKTSVSNHPLPIPSVEKVDTTLIGSDDQAGVLRNSGPSRPDVSSGRFFSSNKHTSKVNQQYHGHKKASQSSMVWKPKTSSKAKPTSHEVSNNSIIPNIEVACSLEKHSHISSNKSEDVFIPQFFRVPDKERAQLKFGSFGDADSMNDSKVEYRAVGNIEDSTKKVPFESTSMIVDMGTNAVEVQVDTVDGSPTTSRSDSLVSTSENLNSSAKDAISCAYNGFAQNFSQSYSSESHRAQNSPRLPKLCEVFDSQQNYDASFFTAVAESTIDQSGLSSHPEVGSHVGNDIPFIAPVQHQSFPQQQVGQLYPQVQFSQFGNYMPYRQILAPICVPSMPNYSSYNMYPHLVMPLGSRHITPIAAVKYTPSQYKAVSDGSPTGYGNFNIAGYNITAPGSGAAIDDVTRIKYNDLYVANPQVEVPGMWIQNQRDPVPYYNMPALGQGAPSHAFFPPNTSHASFNAQTQPATMQFPGMYQRQPPNVIPNPHHMDLL